MSQLLLENVKPLVYYYGDLAAFEKIKPHIVTVISDDSCEWRRSYGRKLRKITFPAITFSKTDSKKLESFKKNDWTLIDHPVLHIFCTECSDVELYKSSIKEEIDTWIKMLMSYNTEDWMILLVETVDIRKTKNILPRSTVLDKIRLDFGSKNGDRIVSILNPAKFEGKSTESFRSLMQRLRFLMLSGYNKNINKYEELIRGYRDQRQKNDWSFLKCFLIQEELAFVLEMLGLYSEALVQYDELEALFSQSVSNSLQGTLPGWLNTFSQPINQFNGLYLSSRLLLSFREKIAQGTINLLELKTYILERQCKLIERTDKPWENAERLIPFLYTTEREIETLGIVIPEGGLACWEFVCSLEILNICDSSQNSKEIMKYSQFSASIWNLTKDKLYEIGQLSGLLPNQKAQTSEQIHKTVLLCGGLEVEGNLEVTEVSQSSKKKVAALQLKDALSSPRKFETLYLELSELAISTYKHVSRFKFARLVGLDLGDFYMTLNEHQKAVIFYTDLLKELQRESWSFLASQVLLRLVKCYKELRDTENYTKACASISCTSELDFSVRMQFFEEFFKLSNSISATTVLENNFKVQEVTLMSKEPILQDSELILQLQIQSNFPREILVSRLEIATESQSEVDLVEAKGEEFSRLQMKLTLDHKQNGTLNTASIVCESKDLKVHNKKSGNRKKTTMLVKTDFTEAFFCEAVLISPGLNIIPLKNKANRVGTWQTTQLNITIGKFSYIFSLLQEVERVVYEVKTKPSLATLSFMNLIAGIKQPLKLIINAGSFHFAQDAVILVKCSKLLKIRSKDCDLPDEVLKSEATVSVWNLQPFEERVIDLEVNCDLITLRKDDKQIIQGINLNVPWARHEISIPLHFTPALTATCRLHSAGNKKFLQVIVKCSSETKLDLINAKMACQQDGVKLIDINPGPKRVTSIVKDLLTSFLWEIQVEPLKTENELSVIQVAFSVDYAENCLPNDVHIFNCTFDVQDYLTLFIVEAKVEPSELCRVGSVCHLHLSVQRVHDNMFDDLMYEVLADQNFWAVCGRTAGIISLDKNKSVDAVLIDVMPLSAGFLPLPSIRISKYVTGGQGKEPDAPKLLPFQSGQIYNSTKSFQIHVLASSNAD